MRAKCVIFAFAAFVALGESTRRPQNLRLPRSPGPVIDTRIFGNWSLVQNTAVSNASDAKFMDYLECQNIPIAIAVDITSAAEGRLIVARDNGTIMGINITVLTLKSPYPGNQLRLPEFHFNDRFTAKWFSKQGPAYMDMVVVRDCYYPAGGTSDVNICGFRHITYPLNATEYYEEYTYRCSEDGQRLTISYLTHDCGPATRTYKRYKKVVERPIDKRIFRTWLFEPEGSFEKIEKYAKCTGMKNFKPTMIPLSNRIYIEFSENSASTGTTYNFSYRIPSFNELIVSSSFLLNEHIRKVAVSYWSEGKEIHDEMETNVVFERYCYIEKRKSAEECGLRINGYDEIGSTISDTICRMADDGYNLLYIMESPGCTSVTLKFKPV